MAERSDMPADFPLPPASFEFLIESVLMQAQIQLGLLHFRNPDDKDEPPPEPNLPLAKHSIDMLEVLQQKTRGNLTGEEQRLLENGLTELRFRYVQAADEQNKRSSSGSAGVSAAKTEDDRPLIITADGGKGTKTS